MASVNFQTPILAEFVRKEPKYKAPKSDSTGLLNTFASLLMAWQARAQERHHLKELDEHLLRDMGITYEEAQHEAAKPFWKA